MEHHDGNDLFSATCPGLFRLDANSGEISVAKALDRDVAPLKGLNGLCIITIQVHVLFYKYLGLAKTRFKSHKSLRRTLFNWTKQDKTCEFSKSSFSKLRPTYKQKIKQAIHLAYVSLMLGGWRNPPTSRITLTLLPTSQHQTDFSANLLASN